MYKPVQYTKIASTCNQYYAQKFAILNRHLTLNKSEIISFRCREDSLQTMLVLTNVYMDMGTRLSQFMTKMLSTSPQYIVIILMALQSISLI